MKVIDIALKDVTSAFRNMLMVGFMFGVPIVTAVIFLLAFGGQDAEMNLGVNVALVNLDVGSEHFDVSTLDTDGLHNTSKTETMGDVLVNVLTSEDLQDLLHIIDYATRAQAETAVNNQDAGVLVVIPQNFTTAVLEPDEEAVVDVRYDPTLTIGPSIVESVLSQILDGFSSSKIALNTTMSHLGADVALLTNEQIIQFSEDASVHNEARDLEIVTPGEEEITEQESFTQVLVMGIMGGMMIFYAFFTGSNMASTILREEEAATLPRLFATPTSMATIMAGKYLAIGLTVFIQIVVLVFIGDVVFGFDWGPIPLVTIAILGTTMVAATFGLFLISWVDNTKQAGSLIGGAITATGMLGMIPTFTGGKSTPQALEIVSLIVPQGWAGRLFSLARNQGSWQAITIALVVLLAWSTVFFLIGRSRFNRRYA